MSNNYGQWSKLLNFFSHICPFWERERLNVCVFIICFCLSLPTNNETMNLALLQKRVSAEQYNAAIQYGNYFITIKVLGWDIFPPSPNVQDMVTALVFINYIVY